MIFRSIKSVLELAETMHSFSQTAKISELDELKTLHKSIHQLKFSELLSHDQRLFTRLSEDTFPEIEDEVEMTEELTDAIREVCQEKLLDCYQYFENKIIQLYQMIRFMFFQI